MIEATRAPFAEAAGIESDDEFFAKAGPLPLHWDDKRRFPRFYYRSRTQALVFPVCAVHELSAAACSVLTRDLSRNGVSVVHSEQLFPGQRIDLTLSDGQIRTMTVTWCRRIADGRYYAGGQFSAS
jgi:hypothetical protein